ncbi:hypothetical protein D3C71_1222460 [compost metagenome]
MALLQLALVVFLALDAAEQGQVMALAGVLVLVQMGNDHALANRQAAIPVAMQAGVFQGIGRQQLAQPLRRAEPGGILGLAEHFADGCIGQGHAAVLAEQQHAFVDPLEQGKQDRLRRQRRGDKVGGSGHGHIGQSKQAPNIRVGPRDGSPPAVSAPRGRIRRRPAAGAYAACWTGPWRRRPRRPRCDRAGAGPS